MNKRKGEIVVIVHGVASNKFVGRAFQKDLEGRGFDVHNETYKTRNITWQQAGLQLRNLVNNLPRKYTRVHFVCHSLGCVVLMKAISHGFNIEIGRIVLMAGPLKGATWVDDIPYGRKLGRLLFTAPMLDSLVDLEAFKELPTLAPYRVLSIKTTKELTLWNPLSWLASKFFVEGHDGFVASEGMVLPYSDVAVIDADHLGMMVDKLVVKTAGDYIEGVSDEVYEV